MAQKDKQVRMMFAGWTQIMGAMEDLANGINEYEKIKISHDLRETMKHITIQTMPFDDKINELRLASENIEDRKTRRLFNDKLDEIEREELSISQGINDMKLWVLNSSMDEQAANNINEILENCENKLSTPYGIKIPSESFNFVRAAVIARDIQQDVRFVNAGDGSVLAMYPEYDAPVMDRIIEGALTMREYMPDIEDIKMGAAMETLDPNDAAMLRFENLSEAMADKIILEGSGSSFLPFAKEERNDGSGRFDVLCRAGGIPNERDRNFRVALETIIKSAYELNGPGGETAEKKALFLVKENERMIKGLEGSGYVFNISHDTIGRDSEAGQSSQLNVSSFLKFDQNRFRYYNNNIVNKAIPVEQKGILGAERYALKLKRAAIMGPGEKVFMSSEQMEEIRARVPSIMNTFKEFSGGVTEGPALLQVYAQAGARIQSLQEERSAARSKGNTTIALAAAREIKDFEIISEAIARAMHEHSAVSEELLLDRSIASFVKEHEFKSFDLDTETKEKAALMKQVVKYCINQSAQQVSGVYENHLRLNRGGNEEYKIGADMLEMTMERIDPERFIDHMIQDESISDEMKQKYIRILEDPGFMQAIHQAVHESIKDVKIGMEPPGFSMDIQDIDTKASKTLAKDEREGREVIDGTRDHVGRPIAPSKGEESIEKEQEKTI